MRRKLLLLKSEMLGGVDLELFSLLEKNEQRQIKLFQLLLEEKGEVSVNNVLTRLSVDRATLKEDLFYLQANLENIKQLEIVIQEGNILLIRHGNIAAVDVYYHCYLRYSTKYQILLYLLENGSFDRQKLVMELNISSATLSRRVKELNDSLNEFHLKIKSGRLTGPESQIRYFYFQLFWFGRPYLENKKEYSDLSGNTFLDLL